MSEHQVMVKKKNKMSSPPGIRVVSSATMTYLPSQYAGNTGTHSGNETVRINCPGIKEIIGHVAKLERTISEQEEIIRGSDRTVSDLLRTKSELALANNEIKEAKLEIKIQRDVNQQIRSTLQSMQGKHNEVCAMLENERNTVQKLEEELSLTKINQEAILRKQLEKLKEQFKRMITSMEKDRSIPTQSSEDVSQVSTAECASGKPKKKGRNKKKGDKEETA